MTSPDFLKFTMRFDPEDDIVARRIEDDVVDRAGIRPKKGMRADIIRHLFALADENPAIRDQIAKRISVPAP